jgi:hypothetical protein
VAGCGCWLWICWSWSSAPRTCPAPPQVVCPTPPWCLACSSLPTLHLPGAWLASCFDLALLSNHFCWCWFGSWCGVVVMNLPWCSTHEQGRFVQMVLAVNSHSDDLVWCGVVLCVCKCLMNLADKFLMFCPISRACPLAVGVDSTPWHPGVCAACLLAWLPGCPGPLLDLLAGDQPTISMSCWWLSTVPFIFDSHLYYCLLVFFFVLFAGNQRRK